jgi:WD40 repeat protein
VTCIAWSPLTIDNPESILAVACVDMTISLHNDAGEQFGFERKSQMEIYTMAWFTSGDYLMAGGSGNLVCIYSREGIYLAKIAEVSDWVWGLNIQPKSNRIAVGTNSGEIKVYELSMIDPFSVSHNRYAFRSNLTDLVIQD